MRRHRWVFAGGLFSFLLVLPALAFAQKVWSGAVDANWTTPGNWVGGVAPVAGDLLDFPEIAANKTNTNNFAPNTSFTSINFSGVSGGYLLSGNGIILSAASVFSQNSANVNQIDFNVQLGANTTFGVTTASGDLRFGGVISGAFAVQKIGDGNLKFLGANTYGGITFVLQGALFVENATGLGAADGTSATGTTVSAAAALLLSNVAVGNEMLSISGVGLNNNGVLIGTGANSWAGPVTLGPNTAMRFDAGRSITFTGVVSGVGRFGMGGDGLYVLANGGNSFTGGVVWGAVSTSGSTLRLGSLQAMPSTTSLNIPAAGTFDLNNFDCLIAGLSGSGTILLGSATLTVNQFTTATFSGPIQGLGGSFQKADIGALTLSGTNGYTGQTLVDAGTLFINGTQQNASVRVNFGATLGGTGSTGPINLINGNVAPGLSPGIINAGNTALTAGNFVVELNGTTVGSGYDQLNVTGTVTLAGAALSATAGFSAPNGSQYIIINNDGVDPVIGTFPGLSQGAFLTISGQPFTISYFGGDGNDVALFTGNISVPALGSIATILLGVFLTIAGAVAVRSRLRAAHTV